MPRMFGTDGVRGLANRALTAQLALDLGDAAVRVLGDDGDKSEFDGRRRALVGRDTRVSGDFLAAALSAGMSAGGFDVIDAGIIPTPGVAYLTSVLNVEMGAVISASHNPMPDNGIKFFARGGFKLPDTKEDEIENVLGQDWERRPVQAWDVSATTRQPQPTCISTIWYPQSPPSGLTSPSRHR